MIKKKDILVSAEGMDWKPVKLTLDTKKYGEIYANKTLILYNVLYNI